MFNILAMFVNNDTIAKYVRGLVGAGFAALLAWKGSWLLPFLTPEVQSAITAAIVGLAVGLWGQMAEKISGPTPAQVDKVVTKATEAGALTATKAAEVKSAVVDDSIK